MKGDITIATIAIAAGVSAAVSLLIDVITKPRLEVRKERILQDKRDLWELRRLLAVLLLHFDRAAVYPGSRSDEEARRQFQSLSDEVVRVDDQAALCADALNSTVRTILSYGLGYHAGLLDAGSRFLKADLGEDADRLQEALFERGGTALDLVLEYLKAPSYRWAHRLSLLRRMKSTMQEWDRERSEAVLASDKGNPEEQSDEPRQ